MDRTEQCACSLTVNNLRPCSWHTHRPMRSLCLLFSGVQPNLPERLFIQAEGSLAETKVPGAIWMQFNSVSGFVVCPYFPKGEPTFLLGKSRIQPRRQHVTSILTHKKHSIKPNITMPHNSRRPLLWGTDNGICPGLSEQTPEDSYPGSPHTSSPHIRPKTTSHAD